MRYLALLLCCLSLGCSSATITMKDGSTASGEISRGDVGRIYLSAMGGEEMGIRRFEIEDIDHPGDRMAIAGAVAVGVGLVGIIVAVGVEDNQPLVAELFKQTLLLSASGVTAVGLGLVIGGWVIYEGSVSAAQPSRKLVVGPKALSDGDLVYFGAGVSALW